MSIKGGLCGEEQWEVGGDKDRMWGENMIKVYCMWKIQDGG
jgi:hypothetical protein